MTAIAPTIPSTLISSDALAAIGAVAQHFPLTLSTTVGFECPLSGSTQADFFLRVSGPWGQSLLAGKPQPPPVLDQFQVDPGLLPPGFTCLWVNTPWSQIRAFAHQWVDPTSLLHTTVEDLWLEFDVVPGAHVLPSPSIFFGVQSSASLDWVGQTALPMLLDSPLPPQAEQILQQCLAAIHAPAKLFQVGILSGRTTTVTGLPAIRLYIRDMALAQIRSTLSHLAWLGDVELLTQLLSRVCQGTDRFTLQLEMQESLSPTIAIECYFSDRLAWQKVLNRLVMTGFCTLERSQALLNYPGCVRAQDPIAPFPSLLKRWSAQLAPYRECVLVKRLAYLKFTYQPGQPLLAKAYLGVSPTWLDARYLEPPPPAVQNSEQASLQHPEQASLAISLCKALIQQLDYAEIDVDEIFPWQRSQKSHWLNQALETMCVGG